MTFDDRYHLHVGYYENGKDVEAIFMKEQDTNKWFLFFDNTYYNTSIDNNEYHFFEGFGHLVKEYTLEEELTFELGSQLLKNFLLEKSII